MAHIQDIAILGAGLIGRLLAYQLIRQGRYIRIYESRTRDDCQSAAYIAAAMLAPLAESAISAPLITELGIASLMHWPTWIAKLNKEYALSPIFFQQRGTLIIWHPQDQNEVQRFYQRLDSHLIRHPQYQPRNVHNEQLTLLEPAIAQRFTQGLYLPSEGQLDNRALLNALCLALEKNNIDIHWKHSASINTIDADLVIDCRGLGAKAEWNQATKTLAVTNQLRGVRGEVIRVYAPDVNIQRPIRLIHPRYPLYIAPKPGNIYVIGATEIESEDLSPVSIRSALELLSAAYSIHPGFGEARILEMHSQCRPALTDNLPKIRWHGKHHVAINGLYRHGYLVAPAIIEATLAMINYIQNPHSIDYSTWQAQQTWPELFDISFETHYASLHQSYSHAL